MKLKKYLEATEITIARFARSCDINENTMNTYVHEKAEPSITNAIKIEKTTHGAVTIEELALEKK